MTLLFSWFYVGLLVVGVTALAVGFASAICIAVSFAGKGGAKAFGGGAGNRTGDDPAVSGFGLRNTSRQECLAEGNEVPPPLTSREWREKKEEIYAAIAKRKQQERAERLRNTTL